MGCDLMPAAQRDKEQEARTKDQGPRGLALRLVQKAFQHLTKQYSFRGSRRNLNRVPMRSSQLLAGKIFVNAKKKRAFNHVVVNF